MAGIGRIKILLLSAVLCLLVAQARAAVVFDSFGPGDSYNTGIGLTLGGPTSSLEWDSACPFIPSADCLVTSVTLPGWRWMGASSLVTVHLTTNVAMMPGVILETSQVNITSLTGEIVTAPFAGTTALSAGTMYWLWLSAEDDFAGAWPINTISVLDGYCWDMAGSGNWVYMSVTESAAFRVEGVVPEPSSCALVVLGLAGVIARRKRVK